MVVLTAPQQPETPRLGSPNKSMELAESLKQMKASETPPRRTEEGSVLVVGSQGENGHANGPLSEVRPHTPPTDFPYRLPALSIDMFTSALVRSTCLQMGHPYVVGSCMQAGSASMHACMST